MSEDPVPRPQDGEDEARLLDRATRGRLLAAAADLAIPDRLRLSERQRAAVSAFGAKLIRVVEDELRSHLSESGAFSSHQALSAAISSGHVAIAGPIIERSGVQQEREMVSALVRRAEEYRRAPSSTPAQLPLLVGLAGDADPVVADLSMAMLIAQSRPHDASDEAGAARTELSAELEHRLVWRVAAALRHYAVVTHGFDPVAADEAIAAAAGSLLSSYDEGEVLEAHAMRLVLRLQDSGRLTDELVARALLDGSFSIFLAAIAARVSLSPACVWDIASDPRGRGLVFLLKAAGVARNDAASILLSLAGSEEQVPAQMDLFEVTDIVAARKAIRLWQIDPAYRESIAELAA